MIRKLLQSVFSVILCPLLMAQEAAISGQSAVAPGSVSAVQSKGGMITLRRGAIVPLVPLETISSATALVGQSVRFAVSTDVKVDGAIVIPGGTPASGVVTYVRKAILGQRNGAVGVEPAEVTLPDGSTLPLRETPYSDPEAQGLTGVMLFIAALPFVFSDMAKEKHPAPQPGEEETLPLCWHWSGSTTKKVRINLAVQTQTRASHPTVDIDSICPPQAKRVLSIDPMLPNPQ